MEKCFERQHWNSTENHFICQDQESGASCHCAIPHNRGLLVVKRAQIQMGLAALRLCRTSTAFSIRMLPVILCCWLRSGILPLNIHMPFLTLDCRHYTFLVLLWIRQRPLAPILDPISSFIRSIQIESHTKRNVGSKFNHRFQSIRWLNHQLIITLIFGMYVIGLIPKTCKLGRLTSSFQWTFGRELLEHHALTQSLPSNTF